MIDEQRAICATGPACDRSAMVLCVCVCVCVRIAEPELNACAQFRNFISIDVYICCANTTQGIMPYPQLECYLKCGSRSGSVKCNF